MKIAFFESPAVDKGVIKQLLGDVEVSFFDEKLDENTVRKAKDAEIISVFINSVISKNIIDKLPNLKFIATRSTGFEHIDLLYCAEKGIKVSYVPSYGDHTVAEIAFGLILNLSRNILKANNYIRATSNFNFSSSFRGFDLNKKTIGVVGTGRIGKNVVKIARGFNMKVVACDLYPDLEFAKINNFEYKNFEEVVQEADVISLHVPFTKENRHMINKDVIAKMKKGVLLINTARGSLIDTQALIWGLQEGIIGGAGLDVLEEERELKTENEIFNAGNPKDINYKILTENHVLMDLPNVIITPHIGFYTKEAEAEIIKTTIENIRGFIDGQFRNLVK
ncbi:MAG: D-isomer specific 2-hydroxyacid dehydrogenase NAD-binding protein [Candidatus Nomurabacteria bacterium GW2011_GWF2_43_8]|uniref:D-isomer specific 2-hydroxyacid dehydrogenase NAD-binding protein n=3 Tax=Candidatus Nomuraibacteriota TaxID=1752729 RepID=A0A0G1FRJ8_9BACT|nr:MAG: D-isomer specific 2-hydroxyacid dehydrogenase NAD-binding protein [Candidatus Nomurabacteria bacterium GW2011_GWA2_43_15]KKT19465.1 MAG: D-isomer specific 2-hydroxyacid dehydrogenase NAD-binding protein [Candidatus Nomurabacteria bacterium GW2011_GWB1_43_7]KKT24678.1 MAG: D-isomer specific 2-hydroxyacid dehydrogenase NAD-binding protein [Candidatus Nomurabacteria bacterium GW2011_GWF2_43_8]